MSNKLENHYFIHMSLNFCTLTVYNLFKRLFYTIDTGGLTWKWISNYRYSESNRLLSTELENFNRRIAEKICSASFTYESCNIASDQVVTLESQDFAQIKMNVLHYTCVRYEEFPRARIHFLEHFPLVRGVNGEVYEILPLEKTSPCKQDSSYTIKRCLDDGDYSPRSVAEIEKLLANNQSKY